MHTLLKITMIDVPLANAAVTDGKLEKIFQQIVKTINPESSFFYSEQGYRAAQFVFDMKDAAQIPQIAEPLFTTLNAKVEFFPAMDMNELTQGLSAWNKQSTNYSSLGSSLN